MSFVILCKTGKCWNQNVLTDLQIQSNFDSKPLICDSTLFPGKNIAKSNCVFPGKGREDRVLILTCLDCLMVEVFLHNCLSFSILVIFREKRVLKVGLKVQNLDPSLFNENLNLSSFFQMFLL